MKRVILAVEVPDHVDSNEVVLAVKRKLLNQTMTMGNNDIINSIKSVVPNVTVWTNSTKL